MKRARFPGFAFAVWGMIEFNAYDMPIGKGIAMRTGSHNDKARSWRCFAAAAFLVLVLCRCSGDPASEGPGSSAAAKPEEEREERVPVKVMPVTTGSISSYIISSATADTENQVEVFSKATGICAAVLVEEGDAVEKDQPLARLVDSEVRLAEIQARVNRDKIAASLKRAESMLKEQLLSDEEYENVRFQFEAADAEWKLAKIRLEDTVITAPITGTIALRNVKAGMNVTPAQPLFRIVDFDSLIATVFVPELEMGNLEVGQQVVIVADALPEKDFECNIKRISPVVDPGSGTVKVTVDLSENCAEIVPGLFIRVKIVLATHENAFIVPKRALLNEEERAYVFVVSDGVAREAELTTGFSDADRVEILSGLGPNDLVVVDGQSRLRDGIGVRIIDESPAAAG
jgi:membrane fusion protein (multidrug efflux system)